MEFASQCVLRGRSFSVALPVESGKVYTIKRKICANQSHFNNRSDMPSNPAAAPVSQGPGRLTTHVLDTMAGRPAPGMAIELHFFGASGWSLIKKVHTNSDGRVDAPLLTGPELVAGRYRLIFAAGDYYRAAGVALPEPPFLDQIPLDFGIADPAGHYHVPLLVTPWSYSTYRGS